MSSSFKFLVLSCLLVSCYCGPVALESWLRDLEWRIRGRGCEDGLAVWLACAGAEPDALVPHPRDCRYFVYCGQPGFPPACRPCPDGLHFNPKLQVCDWPSQANCTARPPPPPPLPSENSTWYPETSTTEWYPPTSTTEWYPETASTTDTTVPEMESDPPANNTDTTRWRGTSPY